MTRKTNNDLVNIPQFSFGGAQAQIAVQSRQSGNIGGPKIIPLEIWKIIGKLGQIYLSSLFSNIQKEVKHKGGMYWYIDCPKIQNGEQAYVKGGGR